MKRKVLLFLSLSIAVSVAISLFWLTKDVPVTAQSVPTQQNPFDPINQKARQARSGDLIDAQDYVTEIVKASGFESELRGLTADAIKIRAGVAESHYRQGLTVGIPESKVVRTVNGLVKKFNLPDFTKTSNYEVRRLRVGLLPSFPQVISQRNAGVQSRGDSAVEPLMSPGEALFVLGMMLQQKLANPEYQLTHSERLAHWAQSHSHGPNDGGSPAMNEGRIREMRGALNQAAGSTSIPDALQLSNLVLNTLGIER